ncbi:hypothetical protein E4J66_05540 [Actinomyces viscosus]|nr:hypothetical protein E4J66_05540 [Actinomyces viscosus]
MSTILRRRRFTPRRRKNGLFYTIVTWIFLAIIAYTALSALWGNGHGWSRILAGWYIGATHDPLDRIKVTLTALGGVGAVGYLVIKYRERSALERGEADDKFVRAVQQLGDASPQVRIAGVYALADVADTYEGPYHQRVVDILCGYLRTDRLLKDANGETRYATNKDGTSDHDKPLSADRAVESTILSVLAKHLKTVSENSFDNITTPGPWSHCTLNLHGTTLTESIHFTGSHIGALNAESLKLTGCATFQDSIFTNPVVFTNSIFTQDVDFSCVRFARRAVFSSVTFMKKINFTGTHFSNVYFDGATFEHRTLFTLTTFTAEAIFDNLNCRQEIHFNDLDFLGFVSFNGATFHRFVDFMGVKFNEETNLECITFKHDAQFLGTTFMGRTRFSNSGFDGVADFTGATFKEASSFTNVTFGGPTSFWGVTFAQECIFHKAKLKRSISFRRSSLPHDISFMGALFLCDVDFWGAKLRNRPKHDGCDYFLGTSFNSSPSVSLYFPDIININDKGLPEGAKWVPEPSNDHHRKGPTDEQRQPDEVTPADSLPQDKGREQHSNEHAQLVDGDDHASGAVLEGPVVAEPGGARSSPGGQDEAELPTRDTANLVELPGDGDHHPGHHQDHPGTDRGTEVRLHPSDTGLAKDRGECGEEG